MYGSSDIYVNAARQIASTGCVVILPDHEDGSTPASLNEHGEFVKENPQPAQPDGPDRAVTQSFRRPFLVHRSHEIDAILNLIYEPSQRNESWHRVLQHCNPHRLIFGGHSFGACHVAHMLSAAEFEYRPFYQKWKEANDPYNSDSPRDGFNVGGLIKIQILITRISYLSY